jgi:hypothetical protein
MQSEEVIRERVKKLHGEPILQERGGWVDYARACTLLEVLGHTDPKPYKGERLSKAHHVDVSDYVEVSD